MTTSFFYPGDSDNLSEDDISATGTTDAVEDDGTPVLDEQDLEENNLTVDEAEDIEWEEPKSNEER